MGDEIKKIEIKKTLIKYLITFGVSFVISFLACIAKNVFKAENAKDVFSSLSDGCFIGGIIVLCTGLLALSAKLGTFDMLAYGFRSIFVVLKKDPRDTKYHNFYEYKEYKDQHRSSYLHLIIVGGFFALLGLLFFLIYYTF